MTAAPTLRFDAAAGDDILPVSLDSLLRTRALIQANSGGGKSHAIRALLEQTHGRVLHLVLDPEGEFSSLREQFPFVLAGGEHGDVPAHPKVAKVLCRRLVETNASAVIDLYDLSHTERREFVKLFLIELMALPRALWKPALVVLDEAHLFCPERGSGEAQSTDAVIALCTQGRKRGFAAVLATQRISKLHKDAAAELSNKLIGRTALDVDMKRAGDELGMDKETRQQLRELKPGEFFAFGPAMGGRVHRVRSSDVLTRHADSNTLVTTPAASASVQALVAQLGDLPKLAVKEADDRAALEREVRELKQQLRSKPVPVATGPSEDALRAEYSRGVEVGFAMARETVKLAATGAQLHVLGRITDLISALQAEVQTTSESVVKDTHVPTPARVQQMERAIARPVAPRAAAVAKPPTRRSAPSVVAADPSIKVSATMRRMLSVLVAMDALGIEWPEKRAMAGWSGVSHTTGTFSNQLRAMRDAGCIETDGQRIRITEVGRAFADPAPAITTLDELHDVWASKFSGTTSRIFRALLQLSGWSCEPVSKAELAAAVGVSHTTGTFSNQLRELRTPGVAEDIPGRGIALTPLVFPEGLS